MKARRALNLRVRSCPHCGLPYATTRPLLRDDGVTTVYDHGDNVCAPDDSPQLQYLTIEGGLIYETDDEC